ncbi:MAG TPA: pitrilysin family protein [Candidatus Paceibacterota bacterium]|nr:pitrilysin family protein [Candidatus Paceibacterota bacterium]
MKYHIHTLKNGLRIVFAPMPGTETATVVVMTGTGSRYENERENGLAHFLEHMFFKGTKKRPTAKAISEELDSVGSQYNAFTAKERTAYWAKVSTEYVDTSLDVISDMFLNSRLPSAEINKERGAVIQEIDMYEDMPMRSMDNVFDAVFFDGNSLSRTILGPKENIRTFKRSDFIAYVQRNYTTENTVICIAGSFNEKKMYEKVAKLFGKLPRRTAPSYERFALAQTEPRTAVKVKKTDQTHFMVGVPAYPYEHPDEHALNVLTNVLSGGMSSRLFLEVREKRGLAYSVHAWVDKYPDTAYLAVQAGIEHAKLEKTISTILAEFKKLKKVKVSKEELAKVKSYMKGTLALRLETSDEVAEYAATSLINVGKIHSVEEIFKKIDAVTADDIQRVAHDLFKTEKLNLAVIGPHESLDYLKPLLKV